MGSALAEVIIHGLGHNLHHSSICQPDTASEHHHGAHAGHPRALEGQVCFCHSILDGKGKGILLIRNSPNLIGEMMWPDQGHTYNQNQN